MKRHAQPTRTTEEPRPQGVGMEDEHAKMGNAWFADQLRAGQPLGGGLRGKAEQSLGTTLEGIRVHQGPEADAMVAERGAEAFAFGDDIVLGSTVANSANPILAHEVAHVASQRGGGSGGGTGASHEADADSGAMAIMAGAPHEMTATNGEVEQCYASHEHAWLGDTAAGSETFVMNGVTLTSGDINALADFFGGVEQLKDPAYARSLAACAALLAREKVNPGSVTTEEWDDATNGRYSKLSVANGNHFGGQDPDMVPDGGQGEGVTNASTWEAGFRTALVLAMDAGSDPAGDNTLEEARITNSFAEHFLEDAFSAGHLFHKGDAMALARNRLAAAGQTETNALLDRVAWPVFEESQTIIEEYQFNTGPMWATPGDWMFSRFVRKGYEVQPELVLNALVLSAHNTLNSRGVSVENDKHQWVLSGDESLATSPETQEYCMEALVAGRAHVSAAFEQGGGTDVEAAVSEVHGLFPRATEAGAADVRTTVDEVTDPLSGMEAALVHELNANIRTVMEGAAEKRPNDVRRNPEIPAGREPAVPEHEGPTLPGGTFHVVTSGDWLSTIAADHYGDPAKYELLFEANSNPAKAAERGTDVVSDPDLIEVGWRLFIPSAGAESEAWNTVPPESLQDLA